MFDIERNKPLPEVSVSAEIPKTLLRLKLGESFVVKTDNERRAALTSGKRLKVKVTSRKLSGKPNDKGYRIWRTE